MRQMIRNTDLFRTEAKMYINDVLRSVENFYPSKFSPSEMYMWCNEVSSMLSIEDRCTYKEIILPVAADNSILLPEGVRMENIESVISAGKVLNPADYRGYDNRKIFFTHMNGIAVPTKPNVGPRVTVVYLVPYEPIRLVRYAGAVEIDKEKNIIYCAKSEFLPGDVLNLSLNVSGDTSDEDIFDILLFRTSYDTQKNMYALEIDAESAARANITHSDNAILRREVTDKTICDAPYDSMYIDYLLAKMNLVQHDMNTYNQYMASFNSRLDAYKRWIINRMPFDKDSSRFKNWW